MTSEFSKNLQLLCSFYKSISEVCRQLGINRSQFNKYLNGSSRPSRNTLHKICNFFGVESYEIELPHHQFSTIVQVRPLRTSQTASPDHLNAIETLQRAGLENLKRYQGFYFEYYYSMSFPGQILRSLIHIVERDHGMFYDRFERLQKPKQGRGRAGFKCHYQGAALYLADRIFLLDYESLTHNEITQTVLFPTYKSRTTYLTGLKLGVTTDATRTPASARVALEVLGEHINIRSALKLCGLLSLDDGSVSREIRAMIDNDINDDQYFLTAKINIGNPVES